MVARGNISRNVSANFGAEEVEGCMRNVGLTDIVKPRYDRWIFLLERFKLFSIRLL